LLGLGESFLGWYLQIKRQEAQDPDDFARREYFSRL
jgi:hypothetical protein